MDSPWLVMEVKMDNSLLSRDEVMKRTSLGRTTIWRLERAGKFPKKRKISENRVGWLASEINEWINDLAA